MVFLMCDQTYHGKTSNLVSTLTSKNTVRDSFVHQLFCDEGLDGTFNWNDRKQFHTQEEKAGSRSCLCVSCVDAHTAHVERSKIISNPAFILLSSHYNSLQIHRQEAGESWQRAGGGGCPQPGGGRLLLLDSVLRHLSAGRSKAAQRRAPVQDAPCRRVPPHHVRQTPQVRMSAHFSSQLMVVGPFSATVFCLPLMRFLAATHTKADLIMIEILFPRVTETCSHAVYLAS